MTAPLPPNEAERLDALRQCRILDTPPEEAFDDVTRLAAQICGVPIAAVSLIDEDRQWFKSIVGLDATETTRGVAFCAHTILQPDLLVVPDAQADARFAANPLVVGDPSIRFYAGAPLVTAEGHALGSLCVIDRQPRRLSPDQQAALRILARQTAGQLDLRRQIAAQERLIAQREQAESALQDSVSLFRAAAASMQEGFLLQDAQGVIRLCNPRANQILGLTAGGIGGEDAPWQAVSDDGADLPTARHPVVRALRGGETVRGEAHGVYTPEGALRWISVSATPLIRDGEATPYAAVCTFDDITEKRQSEEANARLAAFIDSSAEAVLGTTLDGTLVSWNPGAERLYGWTASEAIGRHFSFLAPPGQFAPVTDLLKRLNAGEPVEPLEVVRRRKDGALVDVSLSFSLVRDGRGRVIGHAAIAQDVSARKRAEEALRRSTAHLRAVIAGAPVILFGLDAQGVFTLSEGKGLESLGLRPGEIVGRSIFDQFDDREPIIAGQIRRALGGENVSFISFVGGRTWENQCQPLRAEDGSVQGLLGVSYDITERRRYEAEIKDYSVVLEAKMAELEEANARLAALATTDGLTGLKNHRAFQERLAEEFVRAARYGLPLSVVLLDVDRFKSYNDTFGHPAGDQVLSRVAALLGQSVRDCDLVARYGGEEFVLILPQTDADGAFIVADRCRVAIESAPWEKRPVTASFGIASLLPGMADGAALIAAADEALYLAKADGRNRVAHAGQAAGPTERSEGVGEERVTVQLLCRS